MITSQIKRLYCNLTSAERKVASYVIESPQEITSLTVHQLAENARLLHLRSFNSGMYTLQDTLDKLDFTKIEEMSKVLVQAKHIFLFGIGTSSTVVTDAQYRLSQLGLWATACTDILLMGVTAANLEKGDVVLAISHSGRTKAVIDAVRLAKKKGATVIAITSFTDSLLYQESDVAATVFADEVTYPVEAVSARVAHICLVDSLAMLLAAHNYDSFADHIKSRNDVLEGIRY